MPNRPTIGLRTTMAAAPAILALLAACNDNKGTNPLAQANVRIVNASSSTTALNATAGTQSVGSGVNFQNSSASCAKVNAGSQTVNFTSGSSSTSIGSVNYNFQAGQNYTIVFYGSNNAVVYPETFTAPASGNMALRFINATATAGDIFLTTPTGSVSGTATVANLAAGSVSGFNASSAPGGTFVSTYPVANTRVRLFNVGTTTGTPRADFTIGTMAANRAGTVILTTSSGTGGATGFLVNTCAS